MNADDLFPCSFVIFGATGHLAATKLLPALYHLEAAGRLPEVTNFIAYSRRELDDAAWLRHVESALRAKLEERFDPQVYGRFARRLSYVRGDLREVEGFHRLLAELAKPKTGVCSNIVFYLAIKPAEFGTVAENLAAVGLNRPRGLHRIVIEKPFGEDLESAQALNRVLHRHFDEHQIYRIDHYLGKETVQNLLVFRLANLLVEPLWNRNYIDHVQITVSEQAGVETRADYYDQVGALRDMLQNHMMQLLTLIAMEPPPALEADALRDEKVKVLRCIRPIERRALHAHAVRAQYGPGRIDGRTEPGYQEEPGVDRGSLTETYVAVRLLIDNWRWRGVPFYLRTGKRLARQQTLIAIRFRHVPQQLFRETPLEHTQPNWIVLELQPNEAMHLEVHARQPGLGLHTRMVRMNAGYRAEDERPIDAYETLLLDVVRGDTTNFIRFDEVEWAWRVVDPIIKYWAQERDFLHSYPAGSWGPEEANRLFEWAYQAWRNDP
ncbi:MAG TPA: glucose-6-phosphate dehydrogenase [Burkholderiales bacterium]|nr:glucose-6-phosphate dehydrogenase [Burkholderiales bacterium]